MTSHKIKIPAIYMILLAAFSIITLSCASPSAQTSKQNSQPVIQQIVGSTDWSPATEGSFACQAADPDGDKLTYQWSADNGTITGQGDRISWASPATMGKYNITVIVSDGRGGEAKMTKEVKVLVNEDGSLSPDATVILNLSFSSSDNVTAAKRVRIWTSSPVECRVEGIDARDLKYTWTPSNGRLQAKGLSEGTASKVTWIAPGVAGDFTLEVVATRANGSVARGVVNFKVFCCGN